MLWSKGYAIRPTDGVIGSIEDLLDQHWGGRTTEGKFDHADIESGSSFPDSRGLTVFG